MTSDALPWRATAEPFGTGERLVRNALFLATFVLVWVGTAPFANLSDPKLVVASTDGNLVGQLATLTLTAAMLVFVMRNQPHMLLKAITPILVLTLAWFALSAVFANNPELAMRRVVLAALTIFQAAVFLLLAPGREDFGRLLGTGALIVLALCYGGIVLAPELSIHQFADLREPELAGAWRGAFAHKNGAGAGMALLIFIGIFVYRTGNRRAGFLIVALAGAFLLATKAKSPFRIVPIVLPIVWLLPRLRNPFTQSALLLLAPVAIVALTIGSVVFEPIRTLVEQNISDPSFTGRDVIWTFSIDHTLQRPLFGFGFNAFWGTSELLSAWNTQESWGYRASDAHNSFLNLSVMTGVIGMVLALIWIVAQPLVDFCRCRPDRSDPALTSLFMQVWLFGLCLSSFESIYFSGGSALWFMIVAAIIGLRFQNAFEISR